MDKSTAEAARRRHVVLRGLRLAVVLFLAVGLLGARSLIGCGGLPAGFGGFALGLGTLVAWMGVPVLALVLLLGDNRWRALYALLLAGYTLILVPLGMAVISAIAVVFEIPGGT